MEHLNSHLLKRKVKQKSDTEIEEHNEGLTSLIKYHQGTIKSNPSQHILNETAMLDCTS